MTLLLLIRHAQNDWVQTGRLAGWTAGVHLNDEGKRQAEALGERLAAAKLQAVYSSPLERAVETAAEIVRHYAGMDLKIEEGVGEVRFGDWTGQKLRRLQQLLLLLLTTRRLLNPKLKRKLLQLQLLLPLKGNKEASQSLKRNLKKNNLLLAPLLPKRRNNSLPSQKRTKRKRRKKKRLSKK